MGQTTHKNFTLYPNSRYIYDATYSMVIRTKAATLLFTIVTLRCKTQL